MQEKCGCLPYYMPNFAKVWKKKTVCNSTGLRCLNEVTGEREITDTYSYWTSFMDGLLRHSATECSEAG